MWRRLARACQRPLEADKTPDQRVVAGVRGIGIGAAQQLIEAVFTCRNRIGDVQTQLTETRSADGDQERSCCFGACGEIVEPLFDQIVSRKIVLHGLGLYRGPWHGLTALPYERPAGFSHRSSQASATRSPSGVTW